MTATSIDAQPASSPVGVGLILSMAFRSFVRRIGMHVGFGVLWFFGLMLTMCLTMVCVAFPVGVVMGVSRGAGPDGTAGAAAGMLGIMFVVYAAMIVMMIGAMALHQNVTYAITGADLNGQTMTLSQAVRSGFDRLLPQSLHGLLRSFVDMVVFVVLVGVPFGAVIAMSGETAGRTPDSLVRAIGSQIALLGVAYVVAGCAVLALRAFLGLGPVLVVAESLGPVQAFARSVTLLAGHRLAFLGAKLSVWGSFVVVYLVLVAVMFGAMGLSFDPGSQPGNPAAVFAMFPVLLLIYALMLLVYTFDHVCEAALYVRLAPRAYSVDGVAGVFR